MAAAQPGRKPIIRPSEFVAMTAALARRAPDLKAIWLDGRLDPAFREEIMVAVAAANNCRQCSFAHREWALAEGLPADELAALEGMRAESFDPRKWAAIAWAQAATREGLPEVPADIEANFRADVQRPGAGRHRARHPDDELDEPGQRHRRCRPLTPSR